MTDQFASVSHAPWSEEQLDEALAVLSPAEPPTSGELARLRVRVLDADADAGQSPRAPLGRRRVSRRSKVIAAVTATCIVTGGVSAAATGVFDQQAQTAFSTGTAYPFHIDSSTAQLRASTMTPDGGQAQLWTATGRDQCTAILLDDPGVTPPNKPYHPTAACGSRGNDPTSGQGGGWKSRRTGQQYFVRAGHTNPAAVTVTFTDITGNAYSTPARDGYYILFTPDPSAQDEFNGLSYTDRSGQRTVLIEPHPAPCNGGPGCG